MSRRQREGKGGKDHNGCGNKGCPMCSPGRDIVGTTMDEQRAQLELDEAQQEEQEMRFNNVDEIEAALAAEDPNACNLCQEVLKYLRQRPKVWLVVHPAFKAVVVAPHATAALESAGIETGLRRPKNTEAFEINVDEPVPYEENDTPYMIMRKSL